MGSLKSTIESKSSSEFNSRNSELIADLSATLELLKREVEERDRRLKENLRLIEERLENGGLEVRREIQEIRDACQRNQEELEGVKNEIETIKNAYIFKLEKEIKEAERLFNGNDKDQNLMMFYKKMCIGIENFFVSAKGGAGECLVVVKGELGEMADGINTIGTVFSLIPVGGNLAQNVTRPVEFLLLKADKERQRKFVESAASAGALIELQIVSRIIARELTHIYQNQLVCLSEGDVEKLVKLGVSRISNLFKEGNFKGNISIGKQFLEAIITPSLSKKNGWFGRLIMTKIITRNGKEWFLENIYDKPGVEIEVKEGEKQLVQRYRNAESLPRLYGYRYATEEEIRILTLEPVAETEVKTLKLRPEADEPIPNVSISSMVEMNQNSTLFLSPAGNRTSRHLLSIGIEKEVQEQELNKFLSFVSTGRRSEAEDMLKNNKDLALMYGNITFTYACKRLSKTG